MKPIIIESWIGKEFGPAVSTGQTPDQVGARRPKVYAPVRGLYLCGAATHPGGSVMAVNGRNAAMAVLADSQP